MVQLVKANALLLFLDQDVTAIVSSNMHDAVEITEKSNLVPATIPI